MLSTCSETTKNVNQTPNKQGYTELQRKSNNKEQEIPFGIKLIMISYLQYESGINLILQNVSGTITTKGVFGCALVGRTKSFFLILKRRSSPGLCTGEMHTITLLKQVQQKQIV